MKYSFKNAIGLDEGIAILAKDLGIEVVSEESADIVVTVNECERRAVEVSLSENLASITYGDGKSRFFRGLAILVYWVKKGIKQNSIVENPIFKTNGAMADMSRNIVMNVKTVKTVIRKMALMGLNTFMLYTEDTYELEEHPYFGYMRGRYTCDEIREIDAYALKLGIELIPCVQMLGHLNSHLRWAAAAPYKDGSTTLLVGAKATYDLIDDMLRSISKCFTSRRLHIGMDETRDLGLGAYLTKNGYRDHREIYFEHLEKVKQMALSYGFKPMMWSDMFFRMAGEGLEGYKDYDIRVEFDDNTIAKIPKGVQQVFWDYYRNEEDFYAKTIDKHHKAFGKDTFFAGGIWTWSGHCPLYSRSFKCSIPALKACKSRNVEEIIATIWTNGSEGSIMLGLAGLAWYADFDYKGEYNEKSMKECFEFSCGGVSYDDIMQCELPNHPDGGVVTLVRALLYNDPMAGLLDKQFEGLDLQNFYRNTTKVLAEGAKNKGIFAPFYDVVYKLSDLLINKADFGQRLKSAYDAKDIDTLKSLAEECDVILEKTNALRVAHRKAWMEENKPLGWEAMDIRYGGIIARFETAKARILSYVSGETDRLEELEEERLRFDGKLDVNAEPRFSGMFNWYGYAELATASKI